jgi:hypothetical protein
MEAFWNGDFHDGENIECRLLDYGDMGSGKSLVKFRRNLLHPFSEKKTEAAVSTKTLVTS